MIAPSFVMAKLRLWETLRRLPKVDLHRHLEGSLRLETLADVARIHGVDLPSYNIEALRPYVQVTEDKPDFHAFLRKFEFLRRFYSRREAIERIAYEAVADAAADNVRYLELRFSPATLARDEGFTLLEVMDWVIDAVAQAERDCGTMARLIVTLKREAQSDEAQQVAQAALRRAGRGIVGLDLAGDEVNYPLDPFVETMQAARREGLRLTVHAGEVTGAGSVRQAIEVLGADRIGHGVRAIEDPAVVGLLKRSKVPLEICPTSNIQTAAIPRLSLHPLRLFHRQGIAVTLNTDNPSICSTTLTDEYMIALREMGVNLADLRQMIHNGIEAAFLSREEKRALWQSCHAGYPSDLGMFSVDDLAAERLKLR
jgi:adenosine deaminase